MSDFAHGQDRLAKGRPGGQAPRPSIPYFSDPALKQRLDLLQHLSEYADLLLLVKGRYGVGKSALLARLLERARDHWMACVIVANPLTTRDQLLTQFGNQLGLDLRGIGIEELQAVIEERLTALQRAGRVVLLIIDDAHALAAPVLDLILHLFELKGESGKLVRVLMFTEPSLDETLQSPALRSLRQQVTHTLDVPPLTEDQTKSFLEHYISATGRSDVLPLTAATIDRAYAESGGIPGVLLSLADTLEHAPEPLVERASKPRFSRFFRSPALRALGVAGLVVVLMVALLFQDEINELFNPAGDAQVPVDRPGTVPLALPDPSGKAPPVAGNGPEAVIGRLPQVETPVVSQPPAPPVAEPTPVMPEPRETEAPAKTGADPVAPAASVATSPPAAGESRAPEPESPAPPGAGETPPALLDHAWLSSRTPDHYTLQLLGVRDATALYGFVRENHLENKAAYLQTLHRGEAWHVLLYGDYKDRDAAVRAREQLVRQLRGVQPWPRTFASVQEQLKR